MSEFHKPEETEIDLAELLFYCLKKWRIIIVCMILFGLLLGGYQFADTVSENAVSASAVTADEETQTDAGEEDAQEADGTADMTAALSEYTDDALSETKDGVIPYYVAGIAEKEAYLEELQTYMDTSVLMSLDPYCVDMAKVSCFIDTEDENLTDTLTAAYESYVRDGALAAALSDADLTEADLSSLLQFDGDMTAVETNEEDALVISGAQSGVFTVTAAAADADMASVYADVLEEKLESLAAELSESVGAHTLTILSVQLTQGASDEILAAQSDVRTQYSTTLTELQTLRTNYSTAIDDIDTATASAAYVRQNPLKAALKYGIIGLAAGLFIAVVILVLVYLLGGKLRSVSGFRELYGLSLLGRLTKLCGKKRLFGFIDRLIERIEEGAYFTMTCDEQVKIAAANIRTAAKNEGVTHLMIAGSLKAEEAQLLYTRLAAELADLEISAYSRIVFSASALEELDGYDGIVFLERQNVSFTRLIDEERALAADRGIRILGAVVA